MRLSALWSDARARWAVGLALVVVSLGLCALAAQGRERVPRGVWVESVNVSGLRRELARAALARLAERLRTRKLVVLVGDRLCSVSAHELGLTVDLEATTDAAVRAGRGRGLFGSAWWQVQRWRRPDFIVPVVAFDAAAVERWLTRLDREVVRPTPFDGAIALERDTVVARHPHAGLRIDRVGAERALRELGARERGETPSLPLVEVAPALSPAEVERAVALARRIVAGSVLLVSSDSDLELRLEAGALQRALVSRAERAPHPRLVLGFDPKIVAELVAPTAKAVDREPRNASFDTDRKNQLFIVPEEPGVKLDPRLVADALLEAALAPARRGLLPLDRGAKPTRTASELRTLRITRLVSEFTTFHPCCRPRVENIHRIAALLDGTIIRPGETFSVNAVVGPRTRANGFVPAPTIEEGEMVDSLGGGISQFATTLFKAVFDGGYDIIERQPHSYYFSRYPMGHEATLSYPKPDLVFRNDTAAGMLLRCEAGKTFIRVKVFGDTGGRKVQAKVSSRYDVKRPPVELIPDAKLEPEDEEVEEAGGIGWTVTVGRVVHFPDGTSKEEKRKVTYNPRVRRVRVHPCRIPEGEPGHTGEECPVPEDATEAEGEAEIPDAIAPDSPLDEGF